MSALLARVRNFVVLAILLLAMLGVLALHKDGDSLRDPLILASIGFVVLASFMAADLGSALTLPRVTGYILAGALLGPHVANILSDTVVTDIRMFNTLALGLIAVSAGLELDLKSLRSVAKTLLLTTALKVPLGVCVVGGLLYVLELNFGVLTQGDPIEAFVLALVFGVLSIGTSPAIALAVMTETRAKGRMPELVLGSAVLKDLVVVICLAVAVAIAGSQLSAAAEHSIVDTLARELGLSVGVGVVLGVVYILYVRFAKAEMLLFVVATILLVAELSEAFHLELLLVFITAGFVVRNFSKHAKDLLHPVEMVALPVFVVFFTTAGAGIDLAATIQLLPVAGALVVARAAYFYVAARLGGRLGGEDENVQRRAWLGYLPQAGVTLGLVNLAALKLEAVGTQILALGTAVVALNLLVGPVTLRRVLVSAGNLSRPSFTSRKPSSLPTRPLPEPIEKELNAAKASILSHVAAVTQALCPKVEAAIETKLEPALESGAFSEETINSAFDTDHWPTVLEVSGASVDFVKKVQRSLREVPEKLCVPLTSEDYEPEDDDGAWVRMRSRLRRMGAWLNKRLARREVPLQLFVRTELEPSLSAASREMTVVYCRMLLTTMIDFRAVAIGTRSSEEVVQRAQAEANGFRQRWHSEVDSAFGAAVARLHRRLLDYDGPRRNVPFPSSRAPERAWSARLLKLMIEPPEWERILAAERALLHVEVTLWATRKRVRTHLQELTLELGPIWAQHWRGLEAWRGWLRDVTSEQAEQKRAQLGEQLEALIRSEGMQGLGQVVIRTSRELHELALEFRAISQDLPESLVVYRTTAPLAEVRSPEDLYRHTVFPRQEFLEILVEHLIPEIEASVEEVSERSDRLAQSVTEAQAQLLEALHDSERQFSLVLASAAAELSKVDELLEELDALQVRWEESLVDVVQDGFEHLSNSLTRSTTAALIARQRSRLARMLIAVRDWITRTLSKALRLVAAPLMSALRHANRALEVPAGLRAGEPRQARDCAEEIVKWTAPFGELPAGYAKLFGSEPLREPKLLVGRDGSLEAILDVEVGREGGRSILVDGQPGSGRTSLFNVVQLQLAAARVLRLEHPRSERTSWRVVLADTLGCTARTSAIRRELEREETTVLLDDLEEWISPRPMQMRQDLDELTSLVVATRKTTCWIVSVGTDAHRLYREVSGIDQAFYKTVELKGLGPTELAELVERRHRRSGLRLFYEPTFVTRWVGRLKGADARSVFFRYLSRVTEGNVSRALLTWCNQLHIEESSALETVDLRWSLGFVFITRFGALEVAILVQLSRYRRITFDELAEILRCSRQELTRTLAFLEMARLITSQRWKVTWYTIKPWLRPLIYQALPKGLMRG